MFQLEAMLSLLILALLGSPAFSQGSKSSLESAPLPGGHLIALNPGDMGTFLSLCHRLNIIMGPFFLASRVGRQAVHMAEWLFLSWVFIHTAYHGKETGTRFCTSISKGKVFTGIRAYIKGLVISG